MINSITWIIDSGAFATMTGDSTLFTNYHRVHNIPDVTVANGTNLATIGAGTITLPYPMVELSR